MHGEGTSPTESLDSFKSGTVEKLLPLDPRNTSELPFRIQPFTKYESISYSL